MTAIYTAKAKAMADKWATDGYPGAHATQDQLQALLIEAMRFARGRHPGSVPLDTGEPPCPSPDLAGKDLVELLKQARRHLPLAAASWNEDKDRTVAAHHVAAVLALIKQIDAVLAGPPQTRRSSDKLQELQELVNLLIGAAWLEGGVSEPRRTDAEALTETRTKALMDSIRAALSWEPQFDVTSAKQEELVRQFVAEIAGPKGKPGRLPDEVRLLEMAEELYQAEREEYGP